VLILGMHRSGTSMLAGTLRQAGLDLGRVYDTPFALNPTGLQEPEALIHMHENLLEANGGAWHDPPERVVWGKLHRAVRDLFIESRAGRPLWGFKDPRTLLTLSFWLDGLDTEEVAYIGTFRHPLAVALSLAARNPRNQIAHSIALWCHYNTQMLKAHARRPFPMLDFDLDADAYRTAFSIALEQLGGQRQAAHCGPIFFDQGLRNQARMSDAQLRAHRQVLAAAMPIYQQLCEQRTGGEQPADINPTNS
jgi:hypothetical protein